VQFADGSTAQARARLLVESQPGVASRGTGTASRTAGTGLVIRLNPNPIETRDAFQDYNGSRSLYGRGEALAVLHHPTSKSEGAGFLLRNPVIIMDGFDPNDESKLDVDTKDSKSLLTQLEESGILKGLEDLNRDLIILNFPKSQRRQVSGGLTNDDVDGGTDYVERNAYVLETLLNDLKPRRALDPATGQPYKYTIIGPSIGGLIARYALAHMEQQQLRTDAGLPPDPWWDYNAAEYISLDVPHLGANIPLADQHLLDFFSNVQSARDNLEQRLNSVAAR